MGRAYRRQLMVVEELPTVSSNAFVYPSFIFILRSYFKKFEKFTPDAAYPSIETTERGSTGPVRVGFFNTVSEHSKAFLKACAEVGIPLIPDFNTSKGPIGAARVSLFLSLRVLSDRFSRSVSCMHEFRIPII
jgi:hypothetical protein